MDIIKELFLAEYFKQVAMLGAFCNRKIFDHLAKVFALSAQSSEMLWAAVQQEVVTDVVTPEDANQYKRILQLGTINNMSLPVSDESKSIISIKSKVISDMAAIDMCAERNATSSQILQGLYTHASQGYISAMFSLGTMQCEGNDSLCIERDLESGILNLEKAAHWRHIPSILTLLYYLSNSKYSKRYIKHSSRYYRTLLYTFVINTPYRDILQILKITQKEHCYNAQLFLELLARRKIKSEIYVQSYAKIVYGDTISTPIKERLLPDADDKLISQLASMPMHLSHKALEINKQIFKSLPLVNRKVEQEWLWEEFNRSGDYFFEQRKPLCICCEDRFVLDAYRRCFENMESSGTDPQHVVTIDVAELSDADLQPNADNVFVTNCKNNARNLYLFVLQGSISTNKINAVRNFLQGNKRAKFKLNQPSVTLDLSPIVPMCFCDKQNANKLLGMVNVGMVEILSIEERQVILRQQIENVRRRCADANLCIDDDGIELLSQYPLEIALPALDKIYREGTSNASVNAKDISSHIAEAEKSHNGNRGYGFGGYNK